VSSIYTPPVAQMVTPRFLPDSTRLEVGLWRHFRPLDSGVNVYILKSEETGFSVVADFPVTISIAPFTASTSLALPWITAEALTDPHASPQGTESLAYAPPPPYSYTENWDRTVQQYSLDPYVYTWLRGGVQPYTVSTAIATILTTAGFDLYLT
jgi:hypothetical protein